VLPHRREMIGEENYGEDMEQEGYRWLWNLLQCCVRYTVWENSLEELQNPDGFVNLVRAG